MRGATAEAYSLDTGMAVVGENINLGVTMWGAAESQGKLYFVTSGRNPRVRVFDATTRERDQTLEFALSDVIQVEALAVAGATLLAIGLIANYTFVARAFQLSFGRVTWDMPPGTFAAMNARRAQDSAFRVAIIDPAVTGVDVQNAEFVPLPIDVTRITRLTLNGDAVNVGELTDWRFSKATQTLEHSESAPVLQAQDALVVEYAGAAIAEAMVDSSFGIERIENLHGSDGLTLEDAKTSAMVLLDQYRKPTARVNITVKPKTRRHFEIGHVISAEAALMQSSAVSDAIASDTWISGEVIITGSGKLIGYEVEVERERFTPRFDNFWRQRTSGL